MTTKYTKDHEWVSVDGDVATVGITDYAQEQLGDVVFVDLPDVGDTFDEGDDACVIESVKAASDIYAPISGEILEVNEDLEDNSALVNEDAEGEAWIFKMRISDESELESMMDLEAYKAMIS